ncbi:hypothetical protein SAMN04488056_101441 [Cohaesibacter marisflavi]|uniref:DUF2971 domain-containing protein n=1 Tax=Cohaesibacter marisflavi TaxID=655353 RepID=A0A1I5ACS7_9HYPH|nr:DUF2971 domain-containing protein [Cohaesibacter marisflavi]SFN60331.1 hypothetical protein SAMN04488056_101441 [Cohaesibacter marisflavi]
MHKTENKIYYKYMSLDVAKIVLQNQTLRWSTPSLFNDPLDLQFIPPLLVNEREITHKIKTQIQRVLDGEVKAGPQSPLGVLLRTISPKEDEQVKKQIMDALLSSIPESLERVKKVYPSAMSEVRKQLEKCKALCLTMNPANTAMWGNYADSHKGIVLGFRCVEGLDSPWPLARPMRYVKELPPLLDDDFFINLTLGWPDKGVKRIVDTIAYTKTVEWEHEQEVRLFSGMGRNKIADYEDLPFGAQELCNIIFGQRTTADQRTEIFEQFKNAYPQAAFQYVSADPTSYSLKFAEYTNT